MNNLRQKPDGLTPEIRDLFKAAQLDFDEPPPGYGCDFIVYHPSEPRTTCIEVKSVEKRNRFTNAEKRLKAICERNGIPYTVVITLESAATAAGIRLESEA